MGSAVVKRSYPSLRGVDIILQRPSAPPVGGRGYRQRWASLFTVFTLTTAINTITTIISLYYTTKCILFICGRFKIIPEQQDYSGRRSSAYDTRATTVFYTVPSGVERRNKKTKLTKKRDPGLRARRRSLSVESAFKYARSRGGCSDGALHGSHADASVIWIRRWIVGGKHDE